MGRARKANHRGVLAPMHSKAERAVHIGERAVAEAESVVEAAHTHTHSDIISIVTGTMTAFVRAPISSLRALWRTWLGRMRQLVCYCVGACVCVVEPRYVVNCSAP